VKNNPDVANATQRLIESLARGPVEQMSERACAPQETAKSVLDDLPLRPMEERPGYLVFSYAIGKDRFGRYNNQIMRKPKGGARDRGEIPDWCNPTQWKSLSLAERAQVTA
jgi:hypothetical protein